MATIISEGTFGDRLREARLASGHTLTSLAEVLGVSHQAVQQWESGKDTPRPWRFADIEDAIEVDPGALSRWLRDAPKAGDHPPSTRGKRCFLPYADGLRKRPHVTLPHTTHALT